MADARCFWLLDPANIFLNHGSYGACPRPVLNAQAALRDAMEANPVLFFGDSLAARLDAALACLATFLAADEGNLLFMTNTTVAVNTVVRSLAFSPGAEILITSHVYPAVKNTIMDLAESERLHVVIAAIPFPLANVDQAVQAILASVTTRTELVVLDHVTSPTALVLPLEKILPELTSRGILTLIDGAHAPGMLPLQLETLGADFYAGNLHKWVCAPKGAGFLWIHPRHHHLMKPLVVSNRHIRSRRCDTELRRHFFWTGTRDLSAWLVLPDTLRIMETVYGSWPALMAENHALALAARTILCHALDVFPPAPESMIGAMVAVPLPASLCWRAEESVSLFLPLQRRLQTEFSITVPIVPWPEEHRHLVRISAHRHNRLRHYYHLAEALTALRGG